MSFAVEYISSSSFETLYSYIPFLSFPFTISLKVKKHENQAKENTILFRGTDKTEIKMFNDVLLFKILGSFSSTRKLKFYEDLV